VHRLISNLPGHRIELPDMAEGAGPQERPERRGSPDTGEQPVHRAVPQQAHILDRVIPATNAGTFKVKRKPSAITRLTRRRAPPVPARKGEKTVAMDFGRRSGALSPPRPSTAA